MPAVPVTLVDVPSLKMALAVMVRIALGFDLKLVPGATPKKPASGLIA